MKEEGIIEESDAEIEDQKEKEITIADVKFIPIDGNTYVYITDTQGQVYKQEFAKNEGAIKYRAGMKLKIKYEQGEDGISLVAD